MVTTQRSKGINASTFLALILFLVFPIASLPFILRSIYNRDKIGYVLFCLFMGLVGFLMAPHGDLYRYYIMFEDVKHLSYFEMFSVYNAQQWYDFVLPTISWLVGKMGLTVDWVRFLFNTVGFGIICSIHNIICCHNINNSKRENFFCFLCLVFSSGVISVLYRWGFAVTLFTWAVCLIELRKKNIGWLFIVISGLSHSAMWFIAIIYLVYRIKKQVFSKTALLIFFIITLFASIPFVTRFFETFDLFGLSDRFMIYVAEDGYWNNEYLKDRSFRAVLYSYWGKASLYTVWILTILEGNKKQQFKWPVHMFCFLLVFLAGFTNLAGRISGIFTRLFMIYFCYNAMNITFYKKKRTILMCVLIISFMLGIYASQKRSFIWGNSGKIFYSSLYHIVSSPYENSWIIKNLDGMGLFKDQ